MQATKEWLNIPQEITSLPYQIFKNKLFDYILDLQKTETTILIDQT
jgi:hypothetical protein